MIINFDKLKSKDHIFKIYPKKKKNLFVMGKKYQLLQDGKKFIKNLYEKITYYFIILIITRKYINKLIYNYKNNII